MGNMNEKDKLIEVLTEVLPILSDSISNIIMLLPKDINDFDSDKFNSVRPEVLNLMDHLRTSIDNAPPTSKMLEDDQAREIYASYINALSIIIKGISSLYDFMDEEKKSDKKELEFFIDSLYTGSVKIMELVKDLTN